MKMFHTMGEYQKYFLLPKRQITTYKISAEDNSNKENLNMTKKNVFIICFSCPVCDPFQQDWSNIQKGIY